MKTKNQNIESESNIKKLAMSEISKRDSWDKMKITYIKQMDSYWIVEVVKLPETPGSHRTLYISYDGKIKKYFSGL
jgi:hypothetical protein